MGTRLALLVESTLRPGEFGIRFAAGTRDFLFFRTSRPVVWLTQTSIQWIPSFFPRVKRPGREVDHSSPTSAKVQDDWSCTCDPPLYSFLAWTRKTTFLVLVMCCALHSSTCCRVHCPVLDREQVLFFICFFFSQLFTLLLS